jgi:hypothetical protein
MGDLRAWALLRSWVALKAGEPVSPEDHFPFLGEAETTPAGGGEELIFALIGEATDDTEGDS